METREPIDIVDFGIDFDEALSLAVHKIMVSEGLGGDC